MEPLPAATPSGTSPHVASLLKSFSVVPSAAVPAIIDCVLASSAISLLDLFFSLLQAFPASTEGIPSGYVLSHVSALCHLIESIGSRDDLLTRFIWRVLFPLLKAINPNDVELVNQAKNSLFSFSTDQIRSHVAYGPAPVMTTTTFAASPAVPVLDLRASFLGASSMTNPFARYQSMPTPLTPYFSPSKAVKPANSAYALSSRGFIPSRSSGAGHSSSDNK